MADVFTKEQRSAVMSRIKGKGNKSTELKLIEIFKASGIKGWRRGSKLPGKPDFIFPKLKIAIFADGCFWHGHDCRNVNPSDNKAYWEKKIAGNKARDKRVDKELKSLGWKPLRVWECKIKKLDIKRELAYIRKAQLKNPNI
jgi:DNA mismatch endonuclease (patch repair protein)